MSDYWTGLVNYKQGKAHRYFRAQVDDNGEAIENTICEINFTEERDRIKEQIQQDILSYFDSVAFVHNDHGRDDLCQIVVDNFKGFDQLTFWRGGGCPARDKLQDTSTHTV